MFLSSKAPPEARCPMFEDLPLVFLPRLSAS